MTPKLWVGMANWWDRCCTVFYLWKRCQSEKHTCCTEIISNHHLQTACHKSIFFTADLQKMYSITVSRHNGMVNTEAVLWCCKAKSIFVQLQDSIAEKSKIIKVDKVAKGEAACTLHLLFVTLCFLLLLTLSVSFCQTILACKAELLCMQITAHVSGDLRTLPMAMVLLRIASLRAMIDLVLGMLWPVSWAPPKLHFRNINPESTDFNIYNILERSSKESDHSSRKPTSGCRVTAFTRGTACWRLPANDEK